MNNEINVISENIPLIVHSTWQMTALVSRSLIYILAIINIIIYFATIRKVKHNKIWLVLAIFVIIEGTIQPMIGFIYTPYYTMWIIGFVIQLIIFIKLIINIVKNKKKEEP